MTISFFASMIAPSLLVWRFGPVQAEATRASSNAFERRPSVDFRKDGIIISIAPKNGAGEFIQCSYTNLSELGEQMAKLSHLDKKATEFVCRFAAHSLHTKGWENEGARAFYVLTQAPDFDAFGSLRTKPKGRIEAVLGLLERISFRRAITVLAMAILGWMAFQYHEAANTAASLVLALLIFAMWLIGFWPERKPGAENTQ